MDDLVKMYANLSPGMEEITSKDILDTDNPHNLNFVEDNEEKKIHNKYKELKQRYDKILTKISFIEMKQEKIEAVMEKIKHLPLE